MAEPMLRLKKGDQVRVITGKDKNKEGRILKVNQLSRRVIVEGLNMVKKTKRPQREGEKGSIIELEAALDASNVMIICKKCGPTRIGVRIKDGNKSRICKKCGEKL